MMGLEYPERIQRLVAISANFAPSGIDAEEQQRLLDATPSDHGWFARALYRWRAGSHADWSKLWHAVTTMWRTRPVVDMTELRRIRTPTLLIVGDNDLVTVDHAKEIANELPSAQLAVIDEGHHTSLIWHSDQVNDLITDFLRGSSH
jgi:pimeloyl-ACP methyl ester carboxylesterase